MQQTQINQGWSIQREMQTFFYYTQQLTEAWQTKAAFSGIVAAGVSYTIDFNDFETTFEALVNLFGFDSFLFAIVFLLVAVDFGLGILSAAIKKKFSLPIFRRGLSKLPLYVLYIILVGLAAVCMQRSIGYGGGLLNLFLAYLSITEVFSIIKNLERLGVYMPPLLVHIVHGVQSKIENTIKDTYKDSNGDDLGPDNINKGDGE